MTRRAALVMAALVLVPRRASTQPSSDDLVSRLVALATDPDIMGLDPTRALQRVAFRGGAPRGREDATRAVWDLRDGNVFTLGHLELSRGSTGWQVDVLILLFTTSDEIPLAPLQDALTKQFGAPKDQTMSPQSNTVLRWHGSDRSVTVTADVPGDPDMLVYALRLGRP